MKRTTIAANLILAATMFGSVSAIAQGKVDIGKREYDSNCAVCHGPTGQGNGPYAEYYSGRVPDLTVLAKKNGGVFPMARVYDTIDGEQAVKAHGPRDMPIWGTQYKLRAGEHYVDVPYDPEAYVRARILALAEYIYRLQRK